MTETIKLWRPAGKKELALLEQSGWAKWLPRLAEQPIFYPVLNFEYAEQIARNWNSSQADHDFTGYVTEFELDARYASQFKSEIVGSKQHEELWGPAEMLEEFNAHIVGTIKLVATYVKNQRVS